MAAGVTASTFVDRRLSPTPATATPNRPTITNPVGRDPPNPTGAARIANRATGPGFNDFSFGWMMSGTGADVPETSPPVYSGRSP